MSFRVFCRALCALGLGVNRVWKVDMSVALLETVGVVRIEIQVFWISGMRYICIYAHSHICIHTYIVICIHVYVYTHIYIT